MHCKRYACIKTFVGPALTRVLATGTAVGQKSEWGAEIDIKAKYETEGLGLQYLAALFKEIGGDTPCIKVSQIVN